MLSFLTMNGSLAKDFMHLGSGITNITTITASDKATHSDSELNSVTLFCQETSAPKTYEMKPHMLLLLTRSLIQSILLKQIISHGLLAFPVGSISNQNSLYPIHT